MKHTLHKPRTWLIPYEFRYHWFSFGGRKEKKGYFTVDCDFEWTATLGMARSPCLLGIEIPGSSKFKFHSEKICNHQTPYNFPKSVQLPYGTQLELTAISNKPGRNRAEIILRGWKRIHRFVPPS